MVDKALSQAGKKGAAIKAAKKQAAAEGNPVMLHEFGVIVDPDGTVVDMTEATVRARQAVEDIEVKEAMGTDPEAGSVDTGHSLRPEKDAAERAMQVEDRDRKSAGAIGVDHLEGKGFMIGERMPDGEYRHIARAVDRKVVGEFMTMMDLGIARDKAIEHLNARHGDGAITEGTNLPYHTEGIDSGADLISRVEIEPPEPPKMAPLTEPGVEAGTSAYGQKAPFKGPAEPEYPAPDQPTAILDAVAESEERATRAEETEGRVDVAAVVLPNTLLGRANWYVKHHGLSETDALTMAQVQLGAVATHPTIPGAPLTPGDGEELGPDLTMVAAYKKRMEDYVPPKLEVEIRIENPDGDDWVFDMPVRFLDYLLRSAKWESIKRRRDINPANRLQQILREYRRDDQEVRLLMAPGAASGPAGTFNPAAGRWE